MKTLQFSFILDGGECAVMDSGMGWSWNAVRCVISGEYFDEQKQIALYHQVMFPARVTQPGVPLPPHLRGPVLTSLTGRGILRALWSVSPVRGG